MFNQPIYGLIRKISHKNNLFLGSLAGRSYRRQKFANFKRGLIKSPRMKNLNDMSQIKSELNFLIEDAASLNESNSSSFNAKNKMLVDCLKSHTSASLLPNIKDKSSENESPTASSKSTTSVKQFHFFKCFKKKNESELTAAFNKLSLAKRRSNLSKQTSISLNSINEDFLGMASIQQAKNSAVELKFAMQQKTSNFLLSSDLKYGRKHSLKN